MSNSTWVCFECRLAVRRDSFGVTAVNCSKCGRACCDIGKKIPTPPKDDARAWASLKSALEIESIESVVERHEIGVRHRHDIERQIAKLESLPESEGRRREIKRLRKQLGK